MIAYDSAASSGDVAIVSYSCPAFRWLYLCTLLVACVAPVTVIAYLLFMTAVPLFATLGYCWKGIWLAEMRTGSTEERLT